MTAITCELKWLKGLLLSLGVYHPKAIPLYCDSQSALNIANNPVFHERTKHIEVDCHFIRDAIKDGLIAPSYVPTTARLADVFTKALGKTQFDLHMSKLGICDSHAPTSGGVLRYIRNMVFTILGIFLILLLDAILSFREVIIFLISLLTEWLCTLYYVTLNEKTVKLFCSYYHFVIMQCLIPYFSRKLDPTPRCRMCPCD